MIAKRKAPYERLSKLYGVCYHDIEKNQAVCLPIGLNILCRTLRELWMAIKYPGEDFLERHHQVFLIEQNLKVKRAYVALKQAEEDFALIAREDMDRNEVNQFPPARERAGTALLRVIEALKRMEKEGVR